MKRIDTSTRAVDLFGAGKDGYKDGNKGLGIPATDLNAATLNALQEEIANVIEGVGTALNSADNTQLLQAINKLIKVHADKIVRVASTAAINLAAPGANIDGVAMVAGDTFLEKDHATLASRGVYVWNGAAVPATRDPSADNGAELFGGMIIRVKEGTVNADTNWQVTNDGVVTIGVTGLTFQQINTIADATPTVKGKVLLALAAGFTGTGSATDVPSVAAIIAGLLGSGGASTNDYITIPYRDKTDGTIKKLIIQWGRAINPTAGPIAVTFPIAFPNQNLGAYAFPIVGSPVGWDVASHNGTVSLSQVTFNRRAGNGTTTNTTANFDVFWFAIGN